MMLMNLPTPMPLEPFADFWTVLILLGAVQAFFLTINCWAITRRNQLTHNLLGWLLLSVGLTVVEVLLCYSNYIVYVPFLVGFSEPFNFVFPPLLYVYALQLANPHFQWKASYSWAFLPALLLTIYMIPFFAQSNAWLLQTVAVAYNRPYPIDPAFRNYAWASTYTDFYRVFKYLLVSYQIAYLIATLRVIQHSKRMARAASSSLRWVEQISWSFLVVFLAYTLLTSYYQSDVGDVYVATCVSLVCFGMSFRLITQSKILDDQVATAAFSHSPPIKYEKTALDETTSRQILDQQWQRIALLLPGKASDVGRTATDNRLFINAVLWIARSGAPWRNLPERFGPWNSAYRRFRRWAKTGVWQKVFEQLQEPDLEWLMIDSTVVRAHQHAAGQKKVILPASA